MESAYYIIEHHLPPYTWPLLFLIFILSLCLCIRMSKRGKEGRTRAVISSLLLTYLAAVFFTTLIFRTPAPHPKAEFIPLWSWYEVIFHHDTELFNEILLNILLLMPVGLFLALLYHVKPKNALLIGFLLSLFIETEQLITCRGLFEWDDMLHNAFGCMLGAVIGGCCTKVKWN